MIKPRVWSPHYAGWILYSHHTVLRNAIKFTYCSIRALQCEHCDSLVIKPMVPESHLQLHGVHTAQFRLHNIQWKNTNTLYTLGRIAKDSAEATTAGRLSYSQENNAKDDRCKHCRLHTSVPVHVAEFNMQNYSVLLEK